MAEMQEGVKAEEQAAPVTPPVTETATPTGSEPVQTQEQADYKALYEKAKEEAENKARALKETREKEKAEREARLALEAQMQTQTQNQVPQQNDDEAVQMFYENKAKTDLLTLAVTDPFVKDNFNLVLEELQRNPMQGADVAATRIKASIMDNIIKSAELAQPTPVQQTPTPGAVPEAQNYETFAGDEQNVIDQMEEKLKRIR